MRKYITKASERIGVESTSRDGKRAQVVSYSTCENFIIRFCDGKEMKLKNWRYFIEGNFNYEKHFKAPRNREERIGEKKVMNNGLTAEVIEYRGSHDMDILFEDGGKRTGVSWRDFCIGSIAHPTIPGGNVSQNELVLRFYLESLGFVRIPQRSKRSDRVGLEGKELDLYNDKLKIAIEYDGEYSHTKNKDDEGKNKIVEKLGIKLYRFREPGCSGVSGRNYILEDIVTIYYMHDLVYWKIFYIWCKSILGNLKVALYSCIFSGDFDRNGCWWTDLYCISIVDHRRNHCTYII